MQPTTEGVFYNIPIRLPGDEGVVWISATFPVSRTAWEHVRTVLDVLEPGFVCPDGDSS